MSQKIQVEMNDIGVFDSASNPVLMNGRGCRYLMDIGDIDGDSVAKLQPGVRQVLGAPMYDDYAVGTASFSNGSKAVSFATATLLASKIVRGDLIIGDDGTYYTIDSVDSETALAMRTKYDGTTNATGTYTIRRRVWMLAPFYSSGGTTKISVKQEYKSTKLGTFANTVATAQGLALAQDFKTQIDYTKGSFTVDMAPSTFAPQLSEALTTIIIILPPRPPPRPPPTPSLATKLAEKFTVTSSVSTDGVWFPAWSDSFYESNGLAPPNVKVKVTIQSDAGDAPSGTPVTNATTATDTLQNLGGGKELGAWYGFAGSVALVAGTSYWFVIECISATDTKSKISVYSYTGKSANNVSGLSVKAYSNGSWKAPAGSTSAPEARLLFGLQRYPISGVNTYVSPVFDCGTTPAAHGTLTINAASYPGDATNARYSGWMQNIFTEKWLMSEKSKPDTFAWSLSCSAAADMSTPTVVGTGNYSTLAYAITGAANLKRYYQLTFTMTSATGRSTPLIESATIEFESEVNRPQESSIFHVVGCGNKIFSQIKSGAATISTTAVPAGREVVPVAYQGKLLWSTGGEPPRYYDGVAVTDAALSALLKSDASAGIDPPVRALGLLQHNDKIFAFGDVQLSFFSGTSTAMAAGKLTDTTKAFPTTNTGLQRFRVYPDVANWPLRYWVVTSNTATEIISAGADMTVVAAPGDSYLITKNYQKVGYYTTEVEPADWPTTNFLKFGDDDGDRIQAMVSWKGRLIIVCRDQIWRVTGYGPSIPWEKELMAAQGGTLSPSSVVATEDALYWWSPQGIVGYAGGYSGAASISDRFRDHIEDGITEPLRSEITGVYYRGNCIWSFPTRGSGINNRTVVFNPSTGRWCLRSFGMYAPSVIIDPETQEERLYFWDPRSGCISRFAEYMVTLPSSALDVDLRTAYVTASNPAEMAQWLSLRVVLRYGSAANAILIPEDQIGVEYALDYSDNYVATGALSPIDAERFGGVNARDNVNTNDTVYLCRFDAAARGSAISIRLRGAPSNGLSIMLMELTADPVESNTYG